MVEGFFRAKILSLFHDPPNKPWIIAKKCEAHRFEEKTFKEKHEQEAAWLVERVLGREMLEYMKSPVFKRIYVNADRIAASVDRWILSVMIGGEEKHPVREVELKNIFNPQLSFKPKEKIDGKKMENYASKLKSLVDAACEGGERDLQLLYHLLYSSIEPYFYKEFEEAAGPADTRTPSHTVFDHTAATAMMANWVYGGDDLGGFLVGVDLAGVQEFIARSRKLRDLWVSSWIASALAWSSIKEFVEKLGPDVLVRPSARNNPFYFHQLLLMVKGTNKPDLEEKLKELERWFGYDSTRGPVYAIIPVTLDVVLPRSEVLREMGIIGEGEEHEEIAKKIVNNYVGSWKAFFEKVEKAVLGDLEENGGAFLEKLNEAFKEAKSLKVNRHPPLMMRVGVVSVAGEVGRAHGPALYHNVFRRLGEVMAGLSSIRVDPSTYSDLTDWTEKKCSEGSYGECTVCGKLPAVLELSRDEEEYERMIPARWRVYFDPGEKLCGYCLVKRCAAIRFDVAVEALLGKVEAVETPDFTSTSDIALLSFKEQLVNALAAISEGKISREVKEAVKKHLKECVNIAIKEIAESKEALIHIPVIVARRNRFLKGEGRKLTESEVDEDLLDEMATFYALPSELLLRKARRELQNIERALRAFERGELTVYYAIVVADADNMGDLTFGRASALFKGENLVEAFAQYLYQLIPESTLASKVKEAFTVVAREGEDEAKRKLADIMREIRGSAAAKEDVEEAYSIFRAIVDEEGVILSPAYHVALSRALMVSALKDEEKVESLNGVTIYAGGDDLLAVLPVKNSLKLVAETRKMFEGERNGFHVRERGLVPSLPGIGKSYTILFTHYMHPLYSALRAAHNHMEETSKKAEWREQNKTKLAKDSCTVVFLPRGAGEGKGAPLPLQFNGYGWTLEKAEEIAESVVKGEASHSLLYDLLED
nr:type III-B CRISPR-associated protein Cas10/Cmr2 [Candidatus Freyrarchaeum guaymaensis]